MTRFSKLLPFLLMVVLAISCQDNRVESPPVVEPKTRFFPIDIVDAKTTVEQARKGGRKSASTFWADIKILWENSYYQEDEYGKFLVVPTAHRPFFREFTNTDGSTSRRSYPALNLIVYKDKKGKSLSYFVLFHDDENQSPTGNKWLSTYSGSIIYFDMQGKVEAMRVYKDGKRLASVDENPQGITKGGRCGFMWHCYYTAVDSYEYGVFGHMEISDASCQNDLYYNGRSYYLTDQNNYWDCVNDPTPPTEPIPNPGGGGTGGPSAPSWLNSNLYNYVQDIDIGFQNPCFTEVANKMFSAASSNSQQLGNEIGMLLSTLLSTSTNVKIYLSDENLDGNIDGLFTRDPNVPHQATLKLNSRTLSTASKEYIAATLIHELIHGLYNENGSDLDQVAQHKEMAEKYVYPMAQALVGLYGITETQAKALACGGLPTAYDALQLSPEERIRLNQYNKAYRDGTIGQKCQ